MNPWAIFGITVASVYTVVRLILIFKRYKERRIYTEILYL